MTQDFNYKLMKYLTGNLETNSPTTDEIFKEIVEANRNDWIGFMPSKWTNMHIEGIIKSNTGDVNILYGGYYKDDISNSKGFIIIVDNNFKPIKYIDKFSSGTDLRYIQCLKQDDDGSFYFIDDTAFPFNDNIGPGYLTNGQRRFVMTNNFTIKVGVEYQVNLITSYNFSKSYTGTDIESQMNNIYVENMEKDPNSSNYVFVGKRYNETAGKVGFNLIHIVQLTINVGQANDWKHWTFTNEICYYGGSFISFNSSGSPFFRILGSYDQGRGIYQLTKNYNTDSTSDSVIYTSVTYPDDVIPSRNYDNQCIFLSQNEVYFVVSNQLETWSGGIESKHISLYKYDFSTSTLTQIYDRDLGTNPSASVPYLHKDSIYLAKNQGYLYIQYCKDYVWEDSSYTADYYVQRYEGVWNPILVKEDAKCILNQRGFYVENNYNLVKIFCIPINFRSPTWYFIMIKEIYNPTNYNGIPYENTNSLVPNSGILYNENNNIIFARNLYNKTINKRITQSTIEIPNTYLNNTIINSQELDSKTNNVMVNNINTITKNIYETLFINFINTLQITNENDVNNHILNPTGATRLNISISDLIDYDNAKATKIRINYDDGTNLIRDVSNNIEDIRQVNLLTFTNYDFVVYNPANKNIKTIDIISNDETTIYQTISNLNFESNKYYNIMQPVQILGNV